MTPTPLDSLASRVVRYLKTAPHPQAMIFFGPHAASHRALVERVVQTLFCEAAGRDACGACPSCKRVRSGNHPDYITLKREGTASLGIEAVRDFVRLFAYRPFMKKWRLGAIFNAESLTVQASNALLKIVEEPPAATSMVLTCQNPLQLLATIRSRAIPIFVPEDTTAERLPDDETVHQLLSDAELWDRLAHLDSEERLDEFFELSDELTQDRARGLAFLTAGKLFFSNLIRVRSQVENPAWTGIPEPAPLVRSRWTNLECSNIILAFEGSHGALEFNTALRLVIERILAEIARTPAPAT